MEGGSLPLRPDSRKKLPLGKTTSVVRHLNKVNHLLAANENTKPSPWDGMHDLQSHEKEMIALAQIKSPKDGWYKILHAQVNHHNFLKSIGFEETHDGGVVPIKGSLCDSSKRLMSVSPPMKLSASSSMRSSVTELPSSELIPENGLYSPWYYHQERNMNRYQRYGISGKGPIPTVVAQKQRDLKNQQFIHHSESNMYIPPPNELGHNNPPNQLNDIVSIKPIQSKKSPKLQRQSSSKSTVISVKTMTSSKSKPKHTTKTVPYPSGSDQKKTTVIPIPPSKRKEMMREPHRELSSRYRSTTANNVNKKISF